MTNGYIESTLGDIGKVSMCKRILKNQTTEYGEIPFYKIASFGGVADSFISKELYEEYKRKYSYPNKGDILISAAGTLGRTVIFDGKPSYFQDSNIVWIDNDETKVCNDYLYYFYQTKPWIKTPGSTIDRLYNDNIRNIKIRYPIDIKEQKKIINPLKLIDSKIENNNKINAELESIAKTIYDYWFLQFEFPNEEGKPYKSSGGKMVWNEELKRQIPEGWKSGRFKDFIEIGNGRDHKSLSDGNVPVYGSGGIMRYVDKALYEGESVLIPRKGTLNNIMYVNEKFWTVDTMYYTIMKKSNIAIYMYYSSKLYDYEQLNMGTGVPSMTSSLLYSLKVVVPESSILLKFDNIVKSFYGKIHKNNIENQELSSLRDFLLPLLMNGQVGFKEEALADTE